MPSRAGWISGLALSLAALANAELAIPPSPSRRVNDYAGAIKLAERDRLEQKLLALEARGSNQIVVAIFRSLEGAGLEEYSVRLAQAWRVGQKGLDNGVVFLVFLDDRKMRIEVGYGLEDRLTDLEASAILHEAVAPRFRRGRVAEGIEAGVDGIAKATAGAYLGTPLPPREPLASSNPLAALVMGFLFFVVDLGLLVGLVRAFERERRARRPIGWGRLILVSAAALALLGLVVASPWTPERSLAASFDRAANGAVLAAGFLAVLITLTATARTLWAALRRTWIAAGFALALAGAFGLALDRAGTLPRWGVAILSFALQLSLWFLLIGLGRGIQQLRQSRVARRKTAITFVVAGSLGLLAAAWPPILFFAFLGLVVYVAATKKGSRGTSWSSSRDSSWTSSGPSSSSSSSSSGGYSGGGGRFGGGGASGSW